MLQEREKLCKVPPWARSEITVAEWQNGKTAKYPGKALQSEEKGLHGRVIRQVLTCSQRAKSPVQKRKDGEM
jgi:hypothetical protein